MKPILVVDCYVDGDGSVNFRRLMGARPIVVWRPVDVHHVPELENYAAMMISGSAACVTDPLPWMHPLGESIRNARDEDVPVLGICFGHQIVAHALFGADSVRKAKVPEIGWKQINITAPDPLFQGEGPQFTTFESHFDEVRPGIEGMHVLAHSTDCAVQAFRADGARAWGVQFHAEMSQKEAEELAVIRIGGRPDLGLDIEGTLAASKDSSALARRLINNFLSVQ